MAGKRSVARTGIALALVLAAGAVWLRRLVPEAAPTADAPKPLEAAAAVPLATEGIERLLAFLATPEERLGPPVFPEGARDPFEPARRAPLEIEELPPPEPAGLPAAASADPPSARPPLPSLAGILLSARARLAVLDGEIRCEGDAFGDGWRLAGVRRDAVELAWRGETLLVPLVAVEKIDP